MARTIGVPAPSQRTRSARRMPAAIETTTRRRSATACRDATRDFRHLLRLDRKHHQVRLADGFPVVGSAVRRIRVQAARAGPVPGPRSQLSSRRAAPHQASHQARGHVAAANEGNAHRCDLLIQSRGPKMAVPTRTMVAPSATAASRSALMPIDSVSSECPCRSSSSASSRSRRKGPRASASSVCGGGMHMSPRSRRRGRPATISASARHLRRRDAALAVFRGQPDLQQHVERAGVMRPLGAQPLGDPCPVERMHPLESLCHVAGLVRLQLADEMPGERQVPQRLELGERFLDVVLAELPLTGRGGGAHGPGRLLLAHREQGDRTGRGRPAGRPTRSAQAPMRAFRQRTAERLTYWGPRACSILRPPTPTVRPRTRRVGKRDTDGRRYRPAAGVCRQEQGLRPASLVGRAADDPRRRRHEADQHAAADAQGSAQHGVRHHE